MLSLISKCLLISCIAHKISWENYYSSLSSRNTYLLSNSRFIFVLLTWWIFYWIMILTFIWLKWIRAECGIFLVTSRSSDVHFCLCSMNPCLCYPPILIFSLLNLSAICFSHFLYTYCKLLQVLFETNKYKLVMFISSGFMFIKDNLLLYLSKYFNNLCIL